MIVTCTYTSVSVEMHFKLLDSLQCIVYLYVPILGDLYTWDLLTMSLNALLSRLPIKQAILGKTPIVMPWAAYEFPNVCTIGIWWKIIVYLAWFSVQWELNPQMKYLG